MVPRDAMTKRLPKAGGIVFKPGLKTEEKVLRKFTPVFVSPRPLLLTRLTATCFQRMAISAVQPILRGEPKEYTRLGWASAGTGI